MFVAMLRMALIIINPSDQRHAPLGTFFLQSLYATSSSVWSAMKTVPAFVEFCIYYPLLAALRFIYYQVFTYLPRWIEYKSIKFWYWCRWLHLTWLWWTTLIPSYWNKPPLQPNGKLNGNYWMHTREDLHQLHHQYKDLVARSKRYLDRFEYYRNNYDDLWSRIWHPFLMALLYFTAFWFFVGRIFLYRLGWLHDSNRKRHHRRSSTCFHVHTTALNIDQRTQQNLMAFDSDSCTIICDNSANVHICNDKTMFLGKMRNTNQHYVATNVGNKNSALGMCTVCWRWKDHNSCIHQYDIKDVLYFPNSPVNILSVTGLATQLGDDEGTGIDTRLHTSRFYWNHGRHERTIHHSSSNLPELPINEGFSFTSLRSKFIGTKVDLKKSHSHCHLTHTIPPDDDALEEPKPPLHLDGDMFHVGETFLYSKDGHTCYVRVEKIVMDDDSVFCLHLRSSNSDDLIVTTREFLCAPDSPDVGWIPISLPEKSAADTSLTEKDIKNSDPVTLSPL